MFAENIMFSQQETLCKAQCIHCMDAKHHNTPMDNQHPNNILRNFDSRKVMGYPSWTLNVRRNI